MWSWGPCRPWADPPPTTGNPWRAPPPAISGRSPPPSSIRGRAGRPGWGSRNGRERGVPRVLAGHREESTCVRGKPTRHRVGWRDSNRGGILPVDRPAIVAEGLVKRFGTVEALKGIDLSAMPATILAVLGPN